MRTLCIGLLVLACGPTKDTEDVSNGMDTGVVPPSDTNSPGAAQDEDGDGFTVDEGDCDDADASAYPTAEEICDDIDNNCDGAIDEDGAVGSSLFYDDVDGDGWGDPDTAVMACEAPGGFISTGQDCDDEDEEINPWGLEICDGIDNNCNNLIDEGLETIWYLDSDEDGYGDPDTSIEDCEPAIGYVDNADDCDDTTSGVHPDQSDQCNGVDDDCDGDVDEDVKSGWILVSIDTTANMVYEIDPLTAGVSDVSSISDTSLTINTMDVSESGLAIVQDNGSNQMMLMDACTGNTTPLGPTGMGNMCGIAFGSGGLLYGLDSTNDNLVQINPTTGAGTVIGSLGFDLGNCGLSYDCSNDRLIGADANTNEIFTVNPTTGLASGKTATGVSFVSVGLEFDTGLGILYAATGSGLSEVEPISGATTYIGDLSMHADDLAFYPACP